ncbi:DNA-processing protein DprA [Trichococcus collinsii]|uniref:DNA processing protein n=1 Tax=Trichococcus collinsii TaxID=157076 RepID=A0AB37ZWJ1_9LACT|nr:DNA-processing protein DprA [Trichococcus collinsii]CZQ83015.1 dna recombination-mediator protein a [Trichococcus collinsii]SDZ85867.1 DNA processing protein [Trichococcus collinsii]
MEMNREDLTIRDKLIYHAMTGVCTPNFMKHLYLSWMRDPFYSIEEIVNSYVPMSNETKQQKLKLSLEIAYCKRPFAELKELYRVNNIQVLTILDNGYPEGWLNSYLPPVVLFYAGNIRLLEQPCLSIVGSRSPTAYGKAVMDEMIPPLVAEGVTLVSGLAKGIDQMVHSSTIGYGGATIGIIGSGLDVTYPRENASLQRQMMAEQLVISEYPLGSKPERFHFPMRNRLIANLSLATLVIEAAEKSGSLITANLALQENRDVYAVPGNITSRLSDGTNQLIKAGAACVLNATDVLEEMKTQWR